MRANHREIAKSVVTSGLVTYLWLHFSGYIFYFTYRLLNAEKFPNYFGVLLICITSFLIGSLHILSRLTKPTEFRQLAVISTVLGIFLTVIVVNIFHGNPLSAVEQLASYGFWSFVLGAVMATSIKVKNAI